jgi:hypothetical protein
VYAYRWEAVEHDGYADWLARVVAGEAELGLVDSCLTGFVRLGVAPLVRLPRILPHIGEAAVEGDGEVAHDIAERRYVHGSDSDCPVRRGGEARSGRHPWE